MGDRPRTLVALISLFCATLAGAQNRIAPAEAKDHIGERAIVCGQVASAKFASRTAGNPTFLNLDRPYPNQIFTALIWGSDRAKFSSPEAVYEGRRICVSGPISAYRGVPEIIVHEPAQIRLQ